MEKIDWQENESVLYTLVLTKEKIHQKNSNLFSYSSNK